MSNRLSLARAAVVLRVVLVLMASVPAASQPLAPVSVSVGAYGVVRLQLAAAGHGVVDGALAGGAPAGGAAEAWLVSGPASTEAPMYAVPLDDTSEVIRGVILLAAGGVGAVVGWKGYVATFDAGPEDDIYNLAPVKRAVLLPLAMLSTGAACFGVYRIVVVIKRRRGSVR